MNAAERDELLIRLDERTESLLIEAEKTNGRLGVLEVFKERCKGVFVGGMAVASLPGLGLLAAWVVTKGGE